MEKTAVDQAASAYWSNYFRDYGKMWVRNIPRRIKTAMRYIDDFKGKSIVGSVVPLASDISDDGVISVEAAFVGKIDNKDANVLITAEFNDNGRMRKIEANRVV